MRIARVIVLGLAVVAATAGSAAAGRDQVKFVGIHPIPKAHGSGLCHIEGPHVHVYTPTDVKASYRVDDGAYYFVGDPTRHGWEGEHHEYTGHHPIHVVGAVEVEAEPVYCYLDGVHVHAYAPPPMVFADFELRGGAYVFLGTVPAAPVVVVKPVVKPVVRPVVAPAVIEVIVDGDHHHHHHYKWKKHKHKHKRHHKHRHDD